MTNLCMFALGETKVLPGLLLILVLFPATLWTLGASFKGKRNYFMTVCAMMSAVFGGWGLAAGLLSLVKEGPPEQDLLFGLFFCGFFFAAGIFSLMKMWRGRQKQEASEKAKAPTL